MTNKKTTIQSFNAWTLAIFSSALLVACGGSDSETPTPEEDKTAKHCFDDELNFTTGNSFNIELNIHARAGLAQVARDIKITNNESFITDGIMPPNNIGGLIRRIETTKQINSIPGIAPINTSRSEYIRPITSNTEITNVGNSEFVYFPLIGGSYTITTAYNPEYIDQRRELKINETQKSTKSGIYGTQRNSSIGNQVIEFKEDIQTTYLGDEQIIIENKNISACKFKIINSNSSENTEWIYRGIIVRKESNGSLSEEVTKITTST